MVQVQLNNMYLNIGANNGSEKLWTKKTVSSGRQIKAVYVSYVYVYVGILLRCAYQKTTVSI